MAKYTAVSKEVAKEMSILISKKNNTKIGVATTGYADGEKGGLSYIAIYYNGKSIIKELNIIGDRNKIRDKVAKETLNEIRKIIKKIG